MIKNQMFKTEPTSALDLSINPQLVTEEDQTPLILTKYSSPRCNNRSQINISDPYVSFVLEDTNENIKIKLAECPNQINKFIKEYLAKQRVVTFVNNDS